MFWRPWEFSRFLAFNENKYEGRNCSQLSFRVFCFYFLQLMFNLFFLGKINFFFMKSSGFYCPIHWAWPAQRWIQRLKRAGGREGGRKSPCPQHQVRCKYILGPEVGLQSVKKGSPSQKALKRLALPKSLKGIPNTSQREKSMAQQGNVEGMGSAHPPDHHTTQLKGIWH